MNITTFTGRDSLDGILSGFTRITNRLESFIARRAADADRAAYSEAEAKAEGLAARQDIDRAARTKAKIAELVG